jgi:hypothetical protein
MILARFKWFFSQVLAVAALAGLSGLGMMAQSPAAGAPMVPPAAAPEQDSPVPAAPVTVLEESLIRVMTNAPLDSKRMKDGAQLLFTVSEDVAPGGVLAIPSGATVHGVVIDSRKAGVLTGSPELILKLVSLELGGRSYPLYTYQFKVKGTSKTGPTEKKAVRGAVVGAIVGSINGSAKGGSTDVGKAASIGAGAAAGAAVGTVVSAATPGPGIWIPAESQVDFYLAAPITITPVSAKEAARLGQGLHPGGPALYVRGETP